MYKYIMDKINFVHGDLLTGNDDVIVQQLNCVSNSGRGLYALIAEAFPYADVYKRRERDHIRGVLGMIDISYPPATFSGYSPIVVGMFAQFYPGARHYRGEHILDRPRYFAECLVRLAEWLEEHPQIMSVGFPHKIGCGLAGGDWDHYKIMIGELADKVGTTINVYQL